MHHKNTILSLLTCLDITSIHRPGSRAYSSGSGKAQPGLARIGTFKLSHTFYFPLNWRFQCSSLLGIERRVSPCTAGCSCFGNSPGHSRIASNAQALRSGSHRKRTCMSDTQGSPASGQPPVGTWPQALAHASSTLDARRSAHLLNARMAGQATDSSTWWQMLVHVTTYCPAR